MATQDMIDFHTDVLSSVLTNITEEEDEDEHSDPLVDIEFFKLHGSMTQHERTEVFKSFRSANSGVLLCTVSIFIFLNYTHIGGIPIRTCDSPSR